MCTSLVIRKLNGGRKDLRQVSVLRLLERKGTCVFGYECCGTVRPDKAVYIISIYLKQSEFPPPIMITPTQVILRPR